MSLWGANTANAAQKPKSANDVGAFYNKADIVGSNHSAITSYPGAQHSGWILELVSSTSNFVINAGGTNYANGETVTASNVGATNASAKIVTDNTGKIVGFASFRKGSANASNFSGAVVTITKKISGVVSGGSPANYQDGASVVFTGGGGTGAAATITTNASGGINSISISNTGTGYTSAPTANIGQVINSVSIGAGGTNYANGEALIFTGGGGTGAAATVRTNGTGVINGITITNSGNNYTSAPTVTVNTAAGTGATLTATLPGSGAALTVTLGGASANITLSATDAADRVRRETLVAF